ncbi:glutamine--tRNA ligase/YqeY domain fusion protein [Umboniibacter marinipuniceus]|uniref:Glutamine--tRNA ligase n=1 Tax=Umboniibacter marinipuniceus TaxID=569599 RepID=A0A3M0AF75_9GAMM|nr:glutamine--tRNA ligase/YqeY domain fusion protein [Umboniibacter marinipuniceus]RMA81105.1 glutaminyl-tRNA synthetase [Umboniibacter marinipuniceus]
MSTEKTAPTHFIRKILADDLSSAKHTKIVTRFPPEPNGYLHIGHAKSICLNFGMAQEFGGECNLRFDDTNPEKESQEFIESISQDVKWLGFDWAGEVRFASNYFDQLHNWAIELINKGLAYVCDLTPDEAREYRGSLTAPGTNSPYRERSIEENLALFAQMGAGDFDEGAKVLRAKIDMASPNMNLRDPIIYRIRKVTHHQTGDKWCIYPMYDFTHGLSDAIEGITHSICTLEFEDHRPLYDWFIANVTVPAVPRQYEFARLNLNYTVTSKRKLKHLVDDQVVSGWDDPRMPTIAGMRRRGFTPESLRHFCEMIGVTRQDSVVDVAMLEFAIRDDLDKRAPRAMCVLDPLEIEIANYDEAKVEWLTLAGHPQHDEFATRSVPFARHLVIDRADFREEANKKYKRLVLGKEVRLRGGYVVRADEVIKDSDGHITKVICSYDPETLGQNPTDGRKVKGVIHWVSRDHGKRAEVRLYDRLFNEAAPDKGEDMMASLNPESLVTVSEAFIEPGLASAAAEARFQFEREGYFVADRYDHSEDRPVFNKTIGLRDTWAKAGDNA